MAEITVSKPLYKILTELTGERRFDVALQLATKDLLRLKIQEAEQQVKSFEQRYGMTFEKFQQAWDYEVFVTAQTSPICGIPTIRRLTQTSVNIRVPMNAPMTFSEFIQNIESHLSQP
ncbi:MAG: hypothetical protein ONB46_20760 [candidate division KSB1 bacterium]|nr:hypothetical protein [candidate division KSB1 bacterium]MDZ7368211.1 hypothetical protein [candidate division KSB1 bacterium]MDZ7403951.1 hypothetical protein [candidate division KSB1 bacterium]